jgi:heat shock transcription factor
VRELQHPMSSPTNPRKRPAPGTVPIPQQMPASYNLPPDQLMRWNGNGQGNLVESGATNVNPYTMSPTQAQFPQGVPAPSTALTRRGINNALVTTNRNFSPQPNETWNNFPTDDSLIPTPTNGTMDEHDNIELLEERAQRAKRDAQAKRKQIPPFVQKLIVSLSHQRTRI